MKYHKSFADLNRDFSGNDHKPELPEEVVAEVRHKAETPIFGRWKVFAFISIIALLTVVSVTNVIQVNALLKYKTDLNKEYQKLQYRNDLLRSKINELESPERITKIAKEKMGMINQAQAPQFISK